MQCTLGAHLILLAFTVFGMPWWATAQRPAHVPRIAYLGIESPPAASEPTPFLDPFRQALRERGWVEGHTIAIEWRWAEGSLERFATLVAELIRLPVEVLVVPNATAARVAKEATSTIPIVVVGGSPLVELGLVASLARPGGNVTGVDAMIPEVVTKQLELLKEMSPRVTRVAVLQSRAPSRFIIATREAAAQALGVTLHYFEVQEPTEFDRIFAAMSTAQAEALFVQPDPFWYSHHARLAALAIQHQLPSSCPGRTFAEAGCLMSYSESYVGRGQKIASYVDRILRGSAPADLPVERPATFEFVLNLKTAQALGLTLPSVLLFQADEVFK